MTSEIWIIMLVTAGGHSIQTAGQFHTQQDCTAAAASIQSQSSGRAYCVSRPLSREHQRQLEIQEQGRARPVEERDKGVR